MKKLILEELKEAAKKYGEPRRTAILYAHELPDVEEDEGPEEYPVHVFLSREGYFKKITPQSLRMSGQNIQGGRRPPAELRDHQPGGGHVLHRQVPGLQDPPQRV